MANFSYKKILELVNYLSISELQLLVKIANKIIRKYEE